MKSRSKHCSNAGSSNNGFPAADKGQSAVSYESTQRGHQRRRRRRRGRRGGRRREGEVTLVWARRWGGGGDGLINTPAVVVTSDSFVSTMFFSASPRFRPSVRSSVFAAITMACVTIFTRESTAVCACTPMAVGSSVAGRWPGWRQLQVFDVGKRKHF